MSKGDLAQTKRLYEFWMQNITSRWMASDALNIPLQSVCRYAAKLEQSNRLWPIKRDRCQISGREVWFVSCNPDHRDRSQLSLFDNGGSDD